MTDPEPGRPEPSERERRLAEQLRRNLRRRKAAPAAKPTEREA